MTILYQESKVIKRPTEEQAIKNIMEGEQVKRLLKVTNVDNRIVLLDRQLKRAESLEGSLEKHLDGSIGLEVLKLVEQDNSLLKDPVRLIAKTLQLSRRFVNLTLLLADRLAKVNDS